MAKPNLVSHRGASRIVPDIVEPHYRDISGPEYGVIPYRCSQTYSGDETRWKWSLSGNSSECG